MQIFDASNRLVLIPRCRKKLYYVVKLYLLYAVRFAENT